MAANYGTNPQNPANVTGAQPFNPMTDQKDPSIYTHTTQPKSIRDYLAIARSRTGAPTFTNQPGSTGYQVPDQEMAIPEQPQSEYEKLPFNQRLGIDPHVRAQERVKEFLPDLWAQVFPGRAQGARLNDQEMQQWQGAVQALTGNLFKRFEKQYEWDMKNKSTGVDQRNKDQRYWQSKFVDAQISGNPITNPDGSPVSEADFIQQRMAVSDEMRFKQDMQSQEKGDSAEGAAGAGGAFDFSPEEVMHALQVDPGLGKAVDNQIRVFIQDGAGKELTPSEYQIVLSDPAYNDLVEQSTQEAIRYYADKIRKILMQQQ